MCTTGFFGEPNDRSKLPLSSEYARIIPSLDAETTRLPSDVTARPVTGALCAHKTLMLSPISRSHNVSEPSEAAETASIAPFVVGRTTTWLTPT